MFFTFLYFQNGQKQAYQELIYQSRTFYLLFECAVQYNLSVLFILRYLSPEFRICRRSLPSPCGSQKIPYRNVELQVSENCATA